MLCSASTRPFWSLFSQPATVHARTRLLRLTNRFVVEVDIDDCEYRIGCWRKCAEEDDSNMAFILTPTIVSSGGRPATRNVSSRDGAFSNGMRTTLKRQSESRRATVTCSDMGLSFPVKKYDEEFRIGLISTRWNDRLVSKLQADVKQTLLADGVTDENIVEMQVPGAFELPMAARLMCAAQKVDAVVVVGVLIKGDTDHYDYLASAVSSGLMDLQLTLSIPMVFGVLCCKTEAQAEARSIGDENHANGWARTAMEMANLKKVQLGGVSAGKKSVGFF